MPSPEIYATATTPNKGRWRIKKFIIKSEILISLFFIVLCVWVFSRTTRSWNVNFILFVTSNLKESTKRDKKKTKANVRKKKLTLCEMVWFFSLNLNNETEGKHWIECGLFFFRGSVSFLPIACGNFFLLLQLIITHYSKDSNACLHLLHIVCLSP